MLPIGRSVAEQISGCDEGVMGFHNDRKASGKMPVNDRPELFFVQFIIKYLKQFTFI